MISPTRDIEFINAVMNHPSVHPDIALGHKGSLDATVVLENPKNLFLANEHGGFLLISLGDGVYEVHTQFLPSGRGKIARKAAQEAMDYMFLETDCVKLVTYCPVENLKAINIARYAGFKKTGHSVELNTHCDIYALTIEEWLCPQQYH